MNEELNTEEEQTQTDPNQGDPNPQGAPDTTGSGESSTEQPDPEEARLAQLAAEADQIGAEVTPPEEDNQGQQQGQQGQRTWEQLSTDEKLDTVVTTLYDLQQKVNNGQGGQEQGNPQQPAQQGQQDQSGAADIYGDSFGAPNQIEQQQQPPQSDPAVLAQLERLEQQLSNMTGVVNGLHQQQTTFQQNIEQQTAAQQRQAKIESFQTKYNLDSADAERTLKLFEAGRYEDGMAFAAGRSKVQGATNAQREQRFEDRSIAGRPSIPGGTAPAPEASQALLESKAKEYYGMPDGPDKDDLGMWLIENGGMDIVRKHANELIKAGTSQPVTPV